MSEKADMRDYIKKTVRILILLKALDDEEAIAQLEDDLLDALSRENVKDIKVLASRMSSVLAQSVIKYVKSATKGSSIGQKSNMAKMILYYVAASSFGGDENIKALDTAFVGKGYKPSELKNIKEGIVKSLVKGLNDSLQCLDFEED